jgi:hypothetical protein
MVLRWATRALREWIPLSEGIREDIAGWACWQLGNSEAASFTARITGTLKPALIAKPLVTIRAGRGLVSSLIGELGFLLGNSDPSSSRSRHANRRAHFQHPAKQNATRQQLARFDRSTRFLESAAAHSPFDDWAGCPIPAANRTIFRKGAPNVPQGT